MTTKIIDAFSKYNNNFFCYSENAINIDSEVIAELITQKYGGEDMVIVLKKVYEKLHQKNRYISYPFLPETPQS